MDNSISSRRLSIDALRKRLRDGTPSVPSETERKAVTTPSESPSEGAQKGLTGLLGGEEVNGCYVITKRYEAAYQHAGVPLEALWHCKGSSLATLAKDDRLRSFDFRRTLFLDLETNGLAGGAGTYAFLVGVAYWADDAFYVRQLFMPHPSQEQALLAALTPLLTQYNTFVTFNGKSFDLPILETRYILTRQPRQLKSRAHLDLLHPARRLWKLRLPSCNLSTLEERILGLMRSEEDIPGFMIPHLYNKFLRDGNPAPLKGIFYHNHQDLLTLAALAVQMTRICDDPHRHAAPHGQDFFSLARLYEDNQKWIEAERCYRRTLQFPIPKSLRNDCTRRLSFLLKRQERWPEATNLWRSMLKSGELYAYEELAKYHEHHNRNLIAAERAVLAAFAAARDGILTLAESDTEDLRYRLARIRRKLRT